MVRFIGFVSFLIGGTFGWFKLQTPSLLLGAFGVTLLVGSEIIRIIYKRKINNGKTITSV